MAGYGEMLFFEKKVRLINSCCAEHSIKSLLPYCPAITKTALGLYARILQPFFIILTAINPAMLLDKWSDGTALARRLTD
jgi:hypothetical protein